MPVIQTVGCVPAEYLLQDVLGATVRVSVGTSYIPRMEVLALLETVGVERVEFTNVYQTSAVSEWFVQFISSEIAESFVKNNPVLNALNGRTFSVSLMDRELVYVRVHWVPAILSRDYLYQLASGWGQVRSLEVINNVYQLELMVTMAEKRELPHMVKFEDGSGLFYLVTARGRSPLCLGCKEVGHVRARCPNTEAYRRQARGASGDSGGSRTVTTFTQGVQTDITIEPDVELVKESLDGPCTQDSTQVKCAEAEKIDSDGRSVAVKRPSDVREKEAERGAVSKVKRIEIVAETETEMETTEVRRRKEGNQKVSDIMKTSCAVISGFGDIKSGHSVVGAVRKFGIDHVLLSEKKCFVYVKLSRPSDMHRVVEYCRRCGMKMQTVTEEKYRSWFPDVRFTQEWTDFKTACV